MRGDTTEITPSFTRPLPDGTEQENNIKWEMLKTRKKKAVQGEWKKGWRYSASILNDLLCFLGYNLMKVFEVTTEHCKMNSKEIQTMVRYVTSDDDSLQSVVTHYTNHCSQYKEDLKGVREILDITQNIKPT